MIKKICFFLTLSVSLSTFGQNVNLDRYKYIVVSEKFDFLKKVDQYQTSSLTKFLLKKKGFEVFLGNETLPKEIVNNRCLSLFASVKDESSMLSIKSIIEIKDCYGKVLLATEIGKSKLKDYKKGYHEAIRDAYNSLEEFVYSYKPSMIAKNKNETKVIHTNNTVPKLVSKSEIKIDSNKVSNSVVEMPTILYAQPKVNGFQLVNLKPEVVFVVLKTKIKDTFIIKGKNGILYKRNRIWIAEYYEHEQLKQEEYQVKF